jgi:hypothetical protein
MSSILKEYKNMEKSMAEAVDRLGFSDPEKIKQFTDLTFTEVTNFTYLLTRAKQLQDIGYCPFTTTIEIENPVTHIKVNTEVPLTYAFGKHIEDAAKEWWQLKVSMGRKSRTEVYGVGKAFAGQAGEQREGLWQRFKTGIGFGH